MRCMTFSMGLMISISPRKRLFLKMRTKWWGSLNHLTRRLLLPLKNPNSSDHSRYVCGLNQTLF